MLGRAYRKLSVVLLLCLAALTLTFVPKTAYATSCKQPQLQSSKDRAPYVFTGRVARELQNTATLRVEVQVERVFKGVLPSKVEVGGGGMKGATLQKGERYLIFARHDAGSGLFAHLCGGTMPAAQAAQWIAQLGAGAPPTKGARPVAPTPNEGGDEDEPENKNGATPPAEATSAPFAQPPETRAPAPHAAPTAPPPSAAPPPPTDARRGGCGACSVGRADSTGSASWLCLLIASLVARRRPSRAVHRTGPSLPIQRLHGVVIFASTTKTTNKIPNRVTKPKNQGSTSRCQSCTANMPA